MMNRILLASRAKRLATAIWQGLFNLNEWNMVLVDNTAELIKQIKPRFSCLVLMESCFAGVATDELIAFLVKRYRMLNIAVWNMGPCNDTAAARLIMAGAASFVNLRDSDERGINRAIKTIFEGKPYYSEAVGEIIDHNGMPGFGTAFTRREKEIISLVVRGKNNKEIADSLGISLVTVKYHKSNVIHKAGIKGDSQLCLFGIGQGLIDPENENLELGGMETE
ncbi:hypothetical protein FACS1894110_22410 [Spirochaetia bacterium]|nr:hypothetical protein FACS1894110_22410 [Spirochaetia bacterium]